MKQRLALIENCIDTMSRNQVSSSGWHRGRPVPCAPKGGVTAPQSPQERLPTQGRMLAQNAVHQDLKPMRLQRSLGRCALVEIVESFQQPLQFRTHRKPPSGSPQPVPAAWVGCAKGPACRGATVALRQHWPPIGGRGTPSELCSTPGRLQSSAIVPASVDVQPAPPSPRARQASERLPTRSIRSHTRSSLHIRRQSPATAVFPADRGTPGRLR